MMDERVKQLDRDDPLASFAERFHHLRDETGERLVYLCGNSLGLQPKNTATLVAQELTRWAERGVHGHFEGDHDWYGYHEWFAGPVSRLVGAHPHEVVVMNALTVNLHLMMVSFYRPTPDRFRIVIEGGAFPSDRYAVASQAAHHGYDPDEAVVELTPRPGEHTLRTEDIESWLEDHGGDVALVMLGGVNYYTGQAFDLKRITTAAHKAGAVAGFDLAHAAGNLALTLHDDDVDFAVWCSYKYLNAGPGGVSCAFVHERHGDDPTVPRFAGWWGNDPRTRFTMPDRFVPQPGAAGWQLSNAPILPMAALKASLVHFDEATMPALRRKSLSLTGLMFALLDRANLPGVEIITPRQPASRGCQVSLLVESAEGLFAALEEAGIVCDYRRPDVIRVAPVPLYNSHEDVWRFVDVLRQCRS